MDARFGTLAIAVGLVACAANGAHPDCPGHGGPTWTRVDSPHFQVMSDLDPTENESIARELEQGLDALAQAAFLHTKPQLAKTTVVVLREEQEFHAFAAELSGGIFYRHLPSDLEPEHTILLYGSLGAEARVRCLHELTHDLFARNFGAAPPWLSEGWAQYYSTIRVEGGKIRIGAALPHVTFTTERAAYRGADPDGAYLVAVPIDDVAPPSVLLKLDSEAFYRSVRLDSPDEGDQFRTSAFYLGSWALVHLLHDGANDYSRRFAAFGQEAQGSRASEALAKIFTGVQFERFDRDFRVYLARREMVEFRMPFRPSAEALSLRRRTLTDSEVHVLWGRLFSARPNTRGSWLAELVEAVRLAPDSAEAHYFRGLAFAATGAFPAAESDLATAVALAPSDPRYLFASFNLHAVRATEKTRRLEFVRARAKFERLAVIATSATQLMAAADYYRVDGEAELGLEYARRAVAIDPIDPWVLDIYSGLLAALGRVEEALEVERRAVAFLPEGTREPQLTRQLEKLEARVKRRASSQ